MDAPNPSQSNSPNEISGARKTLVEAVITEAVPKSIADPIFEPTTEPVHDSPMAQTPEASQHAQLISTPAQPADGQNSATASNNHLKRKIELMSFPEEEGSDLSDYPDNISDCSEAQMSERVGTRSLHAPTPDQILATQNANIPSLGKARARQIAADEKCARALLPPRKSARIAQIESDRANTTRSETSISVTDLLVEPSNASRSIPRKIGAASGPKRLSRTSAATRGPSHRTNPYSPVADRPKATRRGKRASRSEKLKHVSKQTPSKIVILKLRRSAAERTPASAPCLVGSSKHARSDVPAQTTLERVRTALERLSGILERPNTEKSISDQCNSSTTDPHSSSLEVASGSPHINAHPRAINEHSTVDTPPQTPNTRIRTPEAASPSCLLGKDATATPPPTQRIDLPPTPDYTPRKEAILNINSSHTPLGKFQRSSLPWTYHTNTPKPLSAKHMMALLVRSASIYVPLYCIKHLQINLPCIKSHQSYLLDRRNFNQVIHSRSHRQFISHTNMTKSSIVHHHLHSALQYPKSSCNSLVSNFNNQPWHRVHQEKLTCLKQPYSPSHPKQLSGRLTIVTRPYFATAPQSYSRKRARALSQNHRPSHLCGRIAVKSFARHCNFSAHTTAAHILQEASREVSCSTNQRTFVTTWTRRL